MSTDPEHFEMDRVDPMDREDYLQARDDWQAERAQLRRELERDAWMDRRREQ